jgi:acyl carrier protein
LVVTAVFLDSLFDRSSAEKAELLVGEATMSTTTDTELSQVVDDEFRSYVGIDITDRSADLFLNLSVDSLAFLNVIARLEARYRIKFANEELPELNTAEALERAIALKLNRRRA